MTRRAFEIFVGAIHVSCALACWHNMFRATLLLSVLAQAGAALGQNLTPAPPSSLTLPLERHLTLAPKPGNPRNSEGDFVQLKDGRWLFVYTHFTSGADDHSKAFLASRESTDGGKSWSAEDQVVVSGEGGFN